jgi:hypothetical protein
VSATCESCGAPVNPRQWQTILEEADWLTDNTRQEDYGHPLDMCTDIAAGWEVILKASIMPHHVPLMMVWLKVCRELNKPKRDNRVDGAGYFKVEDMVIEEFLRRTAELQQLRDEMYAQNEQEAEDVESE